MEKLKSFLFAFLLILAMGTVVFLSYRYQRLAVGTCLPEQGPMESLFKIFIIDNGSAPFFKEHQEQIIDDFRNIPPFSDFFSKTAFYILENSKEQKFNCQTESSGMLSGSPLVCDENQVDSFIRKTCSVSDVSRFVKIVVTESYFGGSGGEVIVIGSRPHAQADVDNASEDLKASLDFSRHIAIHEVAHNMGLGDLYYGTFYFNGDPSRFYSPEVATLFPNTDNAGCPKWCQSFKSVSLYSSSLCPKISNEKECREHGRDSERSCLGYACCVWDENGFPYFGRCAPAFGEENIGIDCLDDTGCYYGAAYGNDAWRPVKKPESIMSETVADKFDAVSERWLGQVLENCFTDRLSLSNAKNVLSFRENYAALIRQLPGFKQSIGLCGE
jgi:hypothetical protein